MVFSSPQFLLAFLPFCLCLYFLVPKLLKNAILLCLSLIFYAWGEGFYVFLMVISIAINYLTGLLIDLLRDEPDHTRPWIEQLKKIPGVSQRAILTYGIVANLAILIAFKYDDFILSQINHLLGPFGLAVSFSTVNHLPIGISFFTFQAISYLVDLHAGRVRVQKNPFYVALYISLFPQLIAGPIVRYHDIHSQLEDRHVSASKFFRGARRFVVGLGKKVLVANTMAEFADPVFAADAKTLSPELAWLALFAYTLQIYFDFSGYSDMAIGLARMFGFSFHENFRYPYVALSVREFWRRWHISLSTWFRDYLYLPLGGSWHGPIKTARNLIIVFTLCGLWHGAAWTFVAWGLYHGLLLSIERTRFSRWLQNGPTLVAWGYTLIVVMWGWLLFRATSLSQVVDFSSALLGQGERQPETIKLDMLVTNELLVAVYVGSVLSLPLFSRTLLGSRALRRFGMNWYQWMQTATLTALLIVSLLKVASETYRPFIYFRF